MKTFSSFFLVLFFLVLAPAHSPSAEGASQGILGCAGFHSFAASGNELRQTLYRFRNFNSDRTQTITQITIYSADGNVLALLLPGGFPAGFNNVLGPHQTSGFSTSNVFASNASPGLLQAIVHWEADRGGGNALYGVTVRADIALNLDGATRGRDVTDCISLR